MFVVSHIPQHIARQDIAFIIVPDTLAALQQLAAWLRSEFSFPVIGITGSNGKTIVKEWLNFLLSPDYSIVRSPKSYNSQVGVPLSVLSMNEWHSLGIFEAGISTRAEMAILENIIKPDIGILTNIGTAHDEGFLGTREKLSEKLLLFTNSTVIICREEDISDIRPTLDRKVLSWSLTNTHADIPVKLRQKKNTSLLSLTYNGKGISIDVPFSDMASIENAMHCISLMLYLDYDPTVIQKRVTMLFPVDMRLIVKQGINGCTIVDDSYSSDFQSLKIALDFLESQSHNRNKTIILSDIYQSGLPTEQLYQNVASLLRQNKIDRLIGIGEVISQYQSLFPNGEMFSNTEHFIDAFESSSFLNESILVKGSRSFGFERIVSLLEERTHETVLEINLNAIVANLNFFRSKLKPTTKLMVMVKAYGYGNGGFELAKLLQHQKVDYLGVAFADEGIALKQSGITVPMMVLNPETSSFPAMIHHKLEPEIYSFKGLKAFISLTSQRNIKAFPIHIKLDTGMHRLGFSQNDLDELGDILSSSREVKVKSILSHLATSDDKQNRSFALQQLEQFRLMSDKLLERLPTTPMRHILNTSGISNYPEAQYDMVRLGIGLYGISNDPAEQHALSLVSTLRSVISQIRVIPKNDSVGYGRRFVASHESRIATIPIGYADGIPIAWGRSGGFVTIHGQKAMITGSVCMDMLMVDVTNIDCREGDRVTIFGDSPSVIEMSEKLHTIPYEILTGISHRVKRIFYRE